MAGWNAEERYSLMINALALNLIADVMAWDMEEATKEYAWLRLMSSVKYDGYSEFRAGARFLESLANWLRQFQPGDRSAAYGFVKTRLIYLSQAEMQRVIELFILETVTRYLRRAAAAEVGIKAWQVWGNPSGVTAFNRLLRQCLFVGLSDGSRIDILRRVNSPRLVQDQFVPMLDIGEEKWVDLGEELAKAQGADARFENVYLIDDFTASGTTFIRQLEGKWKGKLKKFNDLIVKSREQLKERFPVSENYALHIHHYVSTDQACRALAARVVDAQANFASRSFDVVIITEGLRLPPPNLRMTVGEDLLVLGLCDRYYDDHLYQRLKKHCDEAGQTNMKRGYADCALPVVLEHNTPNNTVSLLWAETTGRDGHAMRPLFRRRDRHG